MFRRSKLFAVVSVIAVIIGGTASRAEAEGEGGLVSAQRGQGPGAVVPESVRARANAGRSVRVIVGIRASFRPEGRLNRAAALAQRVGIRDRLRNVMSRLPPAGLARGRAFTTIPFFAAEADAVTLLQLEQDPDVVSIEEDAAVPPSLVQSASIVGATTAWSAGYTGSGWTVAVLDTGVNKSHSFLSGKVVSEACYSHSGGSLGQTSLCPGGVTSSTTSGSGVNCSGYDGCSHGTHVAGIAAGTGSSFHGIARGAGIVAIQVFTGFPATDSSCDGTPCVLSYSSDQIAGLERVLELRDTFNIAAVNMSVGGGAYGDRASCDAANPSVKAAIDNLRSAGIATVIASGNSGFFDSLSAPGCISSVVSVGSTTKSDVVSDFSNTASFLSLLAPGSSITSSVPGGFAAFSGTSMAAPHVAGAWALMKQRKPSAGVSEVLDALRNTGAAVTDPLSGLAFPRIQVDRAIDSFAVKAMSLDAPADVSTVGSSFAVAGWAIDQSAASGTGVDAVHMYAFPSEGGAVFLGASYGVARSDVGTVYGTRFTNSGFSLTASGLSPGTYLIVAYARSTASGSFHISCSATVTVSGPVSNPLAWIDAPADGATVTPSFFAGGWAIDTGAPGGTGVDAIHIYAYPASGSPIFLGAASYGGSRPDVGSAFGSRFTSSGFGLITTPLAPGAYTIAVFFRSTLTGVFASRTITVTVREPGDPLMSLDTPSHGAGVTQPFLLAGWAIDRDALTGTGVDTVHAWAFPVGGGSPIFLSVPEYGGARPDVGGIFGSGFTNCGYNLLVSSLAPGSYDLVVYAHSTVTGTFNQSRVARIVVSP